MEWNRKSSSLWDWENLFEFNAKAAENPKKVLVTDYSIEGDQFFGSGSFDSPEYGGFSIEESGSDIGHASSKSSKSASIYSSSIEENRTTNITIESSEEFLQQFCGKKELVKLETPRSSSIPEVSAGSGEPLLGLELGKRMYFEDIGSGQNAKSSHRSVVAKICKPTNQTASVPRCQVEGCNLDLSLAKDYHRKHRICESHTKSPRIIVASKELRFCQQCSRFHALSEFDDNKRSCRKRLLNHNARRRKPQPEALSLNPTSLSSLYDERQHMNFIFDHAPTLFTRHTANLTWNGTKSSYLGHTRTREYISKPSKAGVAPEQLYPPNDKMSGTGTVSYHSSGRISPSKGTSSEALKSGLEEPVISSNLSTTPNLNRALSLLSTSSGVSCETKPTGQTEVSQPAMTQALPLASDYWQPQQLPVGAHLYLSQNYDDSHFQDLNFFKTPYESRLNSGQFN